MPSPHRHIAVPRDPELDARPASPSRRLDEQLSALSARLPSQAWSKLPDPVDAENAAAGTEALAWVRGSA